MAHAIDKPLEDFISAVRKRFNVERAILFGSRARGDYLNTSDYDVIIVSPDFEGIFFSKRISMMYEFWSHPTLDIEPLCYTPEEFERKCGHIGLVRDAVAEGVLL